MTKGFKKVKEKMEAKDYENNKELIKTVAMTLISNVGGASGPLYGTAFLNISRVISETELDINDLIEIAEEAVAGIQKRGKAEAGEKTMLDTIIPSSQSLKQSKVNDESLIIALKKCL